MDEYIKEFINKTKREASIEKMIDIIIKFINNMIKTDIKSKEFILGYSAGVIYTFAMMGVITKKEVPFVSKTLFEYISNV